MWHDMLLPVQSHTAPAACHACRYLREDIANLQADYTALMYGGISITQKGTKFEKPCPANAFSSGAFSHLFYRWEPAACHTALRAGCACFICLHHSELLGNSKGSRRAH